MNPNDGRRRFKIGDRVCLTGKTAHNHVGEGITATVREIRPDDFPREKREYWIEFDYMLGHTWPYYSYELRKIERLESKSNG
jgi:hypothetical protein